VLWVWFGLYLLNFVAFLYFIAALLALKVGLRAPVDDDEDGEQVPAVCQRIPLQKKGENGTKPICFINLQTLNLMFVFVPRRLDFL
jgi:hypothetical protein